MGKLYRRMVWEEENDRDERGEAGWLRGGVIYKGGEEGGIKNEVVRLLRLDEGRGEE
jgi:hypothetical protein